MSRKINSSFTIDEELLRYLSDEAKESLRSRSSMLGKILADYFSNRVKKGEGQQHGEQEKTA